MTKEAKGVIAIMFDTLRDEEDNPWLNEIVSSEAGVNLENFLWSIDFR